MYVKHVELWADGACWPNPGPTGAWAVVLKVYDGHDGTVMQTESSAVLHEARCTNQRMEILAVVEGLRCVNQPCSIIVFSDSQYVIKTMRDGWKRKKNKDLWERLDQAAEPHGIRWQWVKGHSGIELNERADLLAEVALDAQLRQALKYDVANGTATHEALDTTPTKQSPKDRFIWHPGANRRPPRTSSNHARARNSAN